MFIVLLPDVTAEATSPPMLGAHVRPDWGAYELPVTW
jgi:hypothetical protein